MKKNNKKEKKINKNKLLIIISAVVLLLIIIIGVVVLAIKIQKRDGNSKNKPLSQEDVEKNVKNLFYNDYLISYILEDDVKVGEGTLTIEGEDVVYYAVDDPLLKDIKSPTDIYNLIKETLFSEAVVRTMKLMESEYANQYISQGDTLYVSKTANPCSIYKSEIDKSKIEYQLMDGNMYAIYDNVPYQGYYDEDKKTIKASTLWFACSKNFSNTGTGKDDVYDPNYEEEQEDNQEEQNNENGEN